RVKRILLPLVIGVFTIMPATHIATMLANSPAVSGSPASTLGGQGDGKPEKMDLWKAAAVGNVEYLAENISEENVNRLDPTYGISPLGFAALTGEVESTRLLIERGADVNQRQRDKGTALHNAAFLGRVEVVELLLENGADTTIVNSYGGTPADSLLADWGMTQAIAGSLKIHVDRDELEAGREKIAEMLKAADEQKSASSGLTEEELAKKRAQDKARRDLAGLKLFLFDLPLLGHLWFLAFLCWLVAAFVLYAFAMNAIGFTRLPDWFILSPVRYLWLIPLTLIPQSLMATSGFGPDTSAGLLPKASCLLYYAIFFFVGALYWDSRDDKGRVGRFWYLTIPFALLIVFPIGLDFSTGTLGIVDSWGVEEHRDMLSNLFQVTFAWLLTFGSMGLFRVFFSKESYAMRYISDSSYWLYLAHVPLVIFAQGVVKNWNMPPLAKFLIVCVSVTAILLLSYRYLVRYTIIGRMLNGPRERPGAIMEAEVVAV
ncbi:MAG: acyltransferase family protein, partial [Planctomycetota bacterium]